MKVRIIKELPLQLAHKTKVGDVCEVTAQWGAAVEVRSAKGFTLRLLPDEYEWLTDKGDALHSAGSKE